MSLTPGTGYEPSNRFTWLTIQQYKYSHNTPVSRDLYRRKGYVWFRRNSLSGNRRYEKENEKKRGRMDLLHKLQITKHRWNFGIPLLVLLFCSSAIYNTSFYIVLGSYGCIILWQRQNSKTGYRKNILFI